MLRTLRQQVQQELANVSCWRKPALRRSDASDALLATDLPLIAAADAVRLFIRRMTEQGWRVREERGWLLLDADIPVPEGSIPTAAAGEIGCCLAILQRHPGGDAPPELLRALVKAAESDRLERYCTALHRELAARLRRHEALPGGLLPYLYRACEKEEKR